MHMKWLLLLALVSVAWSAEQTAVEEAEPVAVTVWNRTIAELRAPIDDLTPEDRVARIRRRLEALPVEYLARPVEVRPTTVSGVEVRLISVGGELIMGLSHKDLGQGDDLEATAQLAAKRLREALDARIEQRRPDVLMHAGLWTAAATLVLVVVLWLVVRFHRLTGARIAAIGLALPRIAGLDPLPVVRGLLRLLLRAAAWLAAAAAVYLWLALVLAQFPYTSPLAGVLGHHVLDFLRYLVDGVLRSLPGLGMVLVILILTRMAARALDTFFTSVADGTLQITWMLPETAQATRRIAGIVLWLFAMTVAYPYIPGSSSDAFKGVSVFAGLLLTLGSAGMVNQMMSGLVVVYSRMMKPGDLVKVGEVTGRVTELGFLSTKVQTPTGHEVTLPNAILTGTSVSNFSRFDPQAGPVISTAVTIGYDTPWRQVHALLELAASRTDGVVKDAPPVVLQTALSDFYVEYQLRCRIERVEDRVRVLSALHAQIQDAFNEFGVQIMSPNFEAQPEKPVLVPHDKRAPSPAPPL
jgi:small-conductance mechanosensitive channel